MEPLVVAPEGARPHISLASKRIDNTFTSRRESLKTEILDFTDLSGITANDVKNKENNDPRIVALRRFCLLTKSAMTNMNVSCPAIPPDSIEDTVSLVTQKGAKVVALLGLVPGHEKFGPQILGYGIMMKGRDNIIDLQDIPKELTENRPDACRVIRLFVTENAREVLPRGEAFTMIIDQMKILTDDGILIGKILTGVKADNGSALDPAIWLEAAKALNVRGFADSGFKAPHVFKVNDPAIGSVTVDFEWWTWSKESKATEAEQRLAKKVLDLEHYKALRLAALVPFIPLSSGLISVDGRATHSFDIARAFPGNLVIAPQYQKVERKEIAHNLIPMSPSTDGIYAAENTLDSAIIMGAIPDIINLNPELKPLKAFELYAAAKLKELKINGTLCIRDTIAPDQDRLIRMELAAKEAQIFSDFIKEDREKHIPQNIWESVKEIKAKDKEKTAWVIPLSLYMEFADKVTHPGKDERKRSLAAIRPKDLSSTLEKLGYRLLYNAPEQRDLYEEKTFKGKIDLYELNGEKIKYPPLMQLIIAQKVEKSDAVRIVVDKNDCTSNVDLLTVKRFEEIGADGKVGDIKELVIRKQDKFGNSITHDVLPYFIKDKAGKKRLYFAGRIAPRPIICLADGVDEIHNPFHVEQIGRIFQHGQISSDSEIELNAKAILASRARIAPENIKRFSKPIYGYTRPDALDERLIMQPVEIDEAYFEGIVENRIYDLHSKPILNTFEASKFLLGCQRGVFQDRRIELMVYRAALGNQAEIGKWFLKPLTIKSLDIETSALSDLLRTQELNEFSYRESEIDFPLQFFDSRVSNFVEQDSKGNNIGSAPLEYVVTSQQTNLSNHSSSVCPVVKKGDEIFLGVEQRNFIAAYLHTKNASLLTVPTLRIPRDLSKESEVRWVRDKFKEYFGIELDQMSNMGGKYYDSSGMTPATTQPVVATVKEINKAAKDQLSWVSLRELLANVDQIECLQLKTVIYRMAHMYGLI